MHKSSVGQRFKSVKLKLEVKLKIKMASTSKVLSYKLKSVVIGSAARFEWENHVIQMTIYSR